MPSQCTVTATLSDPSDVLQGNAFVRFRLRGFPGFVPRVLGTAILAETQIDALPDSSGDISLDLWGNDSIDPSNTWYTVEWFNGGRITSSGNFYITGTAYNLDTAPIMNPPALPQGVTLQGLAQYTLLKTDGTPNGSQAQLNLVSGSNITLTDNGTGSVTVAAAVPSALTLEHDGVANGSQSLLNLKSGSGITVADDGIGGVTVAATGGGSGIPDPSSAQFSLWFPNNLGTDNQIFTPSSVWGTRVVSTGQATSFYMPLDAVGNWTTPVAITKNQASPDQYMGYSGNILVNNTSTSKLQASGNAWIYPGRAGKFITKTMAAAGVSNFRHWTGIFDDFADISVLEPASAAASVAGAMFFFNYNDSVNLQCFTSNRSGSYNLVDSGVALTTVAVRKLEIDWDGAGTYVFKIDGSIVATISTFTPISSLGSGMCMMYALASNGNGTGQGTRVAMLYGENSY